MKCALILSCLCLIAWARAYNLTLPGAPLKVVYIDWQNIVWSAPEKTVTNAVDAGYNVVIIAFYLSSGASADMAQGWQGLTSSVKQSTMQTVHSKGAVVLVSLGGSTDSPFTKDATALGKQVATWAKNNYLDGVDFDLENFGPGLVAQGKTAEQTVQWIVDLTDAARSVLGSSGIISHAPQGPYFGPIGATNTWAGATGGYTAVEKKTSNVNFYNIQFYNQGAGCYVDYNGLFVTSCSGFKSTSVMEIAKAGVPLSKIVIGKPATGASAGSGFVSPSSLGSWFKTAKSQFGWNTGVMVWEWADAGTLTSWIQAVY